MKKEKRKDYTHIIVVIPAIIVFLIFGLAVVLDQTTASVLVTLLLIVCGIGAEGLFFWLNEKEIKK